ncbi:MAG TPA: hypothetical protein VGC54_14470 [Planctomycetota bacterium]
MSHAHSNTRYRSSPRAIRVLGGIAAVGGAVFLIGLFRAPERVWPAFLIGFVMVTGFGLAGLLFLAALRAANAGWAAALRRVPEAMSRCVPWFGALGLVLLLGIPFLYSWSDPAVVEGDVLLEGKTGYLNTPAFAVRLLAVFLVWTGFARVFALQARQQDQAGSSARSRRRELITAAAFFAAFAITWSLASFDWMLSLEPHWFSTIYTLYTLAGLASAGLAVAIVLLLAMHRAGALGGALREEHLHDLGKLLLSFSIFWVYIWYCQYVLIWYTDIPEETVWYLARKEGAWASLTPVNLALNWLVPFLVLLPRATKRNAKVLNRIAWVVLAGHLIDLYLLMGPPLMDGGPRFGVWELVPIGGFVAFFFLLALHALGKQSAVPARDPYLAESLGYSA